MGDIGVRVVDFRQIGDHTEFALQVSYQGSSRTVSRRFKDFEDLHNALSVKRNAPGVELPAKQWFGRFKADFLEKRKQQLQRYMDALLAVERLCSHRTMSTFLDLASSRGVGGGGGDGGGHGMGNGGGGGGGGGGAGGGRGGMGGGTGARGGGGHGDGGSHGDGQQFTTAHSASAPAAPPLSRAEQEEARAIAEEERLLAITQRLERNFIDIVKRDPVDPASCQERRADVLAACSNFSSVDFSGCVGLGGPLRALPKAAARDGTEFSAAEKLALLAEPAGVSAETVAALASALEAAQSGIARQAREIAASKDLVDDLTVMGDLPTE
jgi:hypothetical protein